MTLSRRRKLLARSLGGAASIALGSGFPAALRAQADAGGYPSRPIRWIVPAPPGGVTDTVARVFGQALQEAWGQPVIVENRPGAASNLGMEAVFRAPADGHTLLLAFPTLATNGELFRGRLAFDPQRAFVGVSQVLAIPNAIVVPAAAPWQRIEDLLAQARARPGSLSYGSAGIGTITHLGMELFKTLLGVDIAHVPYKGSAPVIQDLAAGALPLASDNLPTHVPQIRAGRERALLILGQQRVAATPEVRTMADLGHRDFETSGWVGMAVREATPRPIVEKLAREMQRIAQLPEVRRRFEEPGFVMVGGSSEQFDRLIAGDAAKWQRLIREHGIRAE
jgi:tripartite-type tricarboxylate transporter receptor subunit TctC